jgi:hypothetical protein
LAGAKTTQSLLSEKAIFRMNLPRDTDLFSVMAVLDDLNQGEIVDDEVIDRLCTRLKLRGEWSCVRLGGGLDPMIP